MNHIRITSEGTAGTTKVTIVETGEDISHLVCAITWRLDCNADRIAWAEVTLVSTEFDVTGEARALIQRVGAA